MIKGILPYVETVRPWTSEYAEARFLDLADQLGVS